jgi:hypothetical protein
VEDGPFAEVLQALGRLIIDRFRETAQEQTTDLLGGFAGGIIEWGVRAVFLLMGVMARALLLAFGPQAEFLQGILVGAPWELTAGLPEVQATTRIAQGIAFALMPVAVAWGGLGYMASYAEGGAEGFAKRVVGGGVLVAFLPFVLDLSLRLVHALGMALASSGGAVPGYASVSEAVMEGIIVASAVAPPVSGPPGGALSQTMLSLASDDSVAAGAIAFVYALAVVLGGAAAAARIAVLDALYVLSPLAALCVMASGGAPFFAVWARAWATVLLIVLPAGMVLKFGAALITAFAAGGPFWVALIGGVAIAMYGTLVGRASFGMALSAPSMARKVVTVVGGKA